MTFLLEVYGQLEEPDGLTGLMQLRPGGANTSDQILAAEKAGTWSEALSLYEQALECGGGAAAAAASGSGLLAVAGGVNGANGAAAQAAVGAAAAAVAGDEVGGGGCGEVGLSPLQQGHLRCLLQMGHLKTLQRQVRWSGDP